MCRGAAVLYKIPRLVVGKNRTSCGPKAYVRSSGAEIIVLDNPECRERRERFIQKHPALWNEDIAI